jgi:hypothetical protein
VNTFLTELSKKLAERWLSLLVLPGLLFLATGWVARTLGFTHALDHRMALAAAQKQTQMFTGQPVTVGALVIAVLLGAAAVGLLANALSKPVEQLWLGNWHVPFRAPPTVPRTWIGKRMRLLDNRIKAQYFDLQVSLAWPRIWLLLTEETRTVVETAQNRVGAATTLAGWGLLYFALGVAWWPAMLVGGLILWTAWRRGRESVHGYASLVEAVIDIHQGKLATALGVDLPQGVIAANEAADINDRLHKGQPELPA